MKHFMILVAVFAVALFACEPPKAQAQSRIVLKIKDVTDGLNPSAAKAADKDWVAILAVSFDAVTPSSGSYSSGMPSIEKLVLRKPSDSASAALLERWMTSATLPEVEIEYRRTIGTAEVVALRYKLLSATVIASRFAMDSSSSNPAVDQVEFVFSKLEMTAYEYDSKAKLLGSHIAVFDTGR